MAKKYIVIDEQGHRQKMKAYSRDVLNYDDQLTSHEVSSRLVKAGWIRTEAVEDGKQYVHHFHPDSSKKMIPCVKDEVVRIEIRDEIRNATPSIKVPEVANALRLYTSSFKLLKSLNVVKNQKDFTSQLGEYLISIYLGGERAESGIQADWDIVLPDGTKTQVKSHAKALTTTVEYSDARYNENSDFDLFHIVVFSPNYECMKVYELSKQQLISRARKERIYWNQIDDCLIYEGPTFND